MPRKQQKDAEFEEFVQAHHRDWQRLAFLMTGDPHLAQDLLQQVLAGTYAAWTRIDDPDHYVRRALANARRSWWRRRWRGEIPTPTAHLPDAPAHDDHAAVEVRSMLWQALQALPSRQRAVLVLRYLDDRPDGEIARLLGMSQATVRSHAHRGLKALADRAGSRIRLTPVATEPTGRPHPQNRRVMSPTRQAPANTSYPLQETHHA